MKQKYLWLITVVLLLVYLSNSILKTNHHGFELLQRCAGAILTLSLLGALFAALFSLIPQKGKTFVQKFEPALPISISVWAIISTLSTLVALHLLQNSMNERAPVITYERAPAFSPPKGELAFLLQYDNRMPSDVGFLTNHIMERRMANLMKENYEPFMHSFIKEGPLVVDYSNQVIFATFYAQTSNQFVIVDVANDVIWIDYYRGDTALHYSDRTSLPKPVLKSPL